MKVKDVVAAIKAASPYPETYETKPRFSDKPVLMHTCDVLHFGDMENEVHKIGTCFMVTVDVIRKAMAEGVDMIITHEPSNCGGLDRSFPFENNEIYQQKADLIARSGISVWRYHDGAHAQKPDLIYRGWMKKFGWGDYLVPGPNNHEYRIPETNLKDITDYFKEKLGYNGLRVIGAPDTKVTRVGVLVGGGSQGLGNPNMPVQFVLEKNLDLLICGEISELMLCTFMQDAISLGKKTSMLIIGHHKTEECGMEYMAEWLHEVVPEIPAVYIEAKDPLYII